MSVTSETNQWRYTGDGATTTFYFDNVIYAASDMDVYVDGARKVLVTDYAVTGVGSPNGGSVVFVTPPAEDAEVVLVSDIPDTQATTWPEGGVFPSSQTGTALDRMARLAGQNKWRTARALRLADSDGQTNFVGALPALAARQNGGLGSVLAFDGVKGEPYAAAGSPAGDILISAALVPFLQCADVPTARAELGAEAQNARLDDIANLNLTKGDLFIFDGAHVSRLAAGATGLALVSQGAGALPAWAAIAQMVGFSRDLVGKATSATAIQWTVGQLIAATTLGGQIYPGFNLTLNFDGSTAGAGGMDTGAMPAAGDLHIYAIYNPNGQTWRTLGYAANVNTASPIYPGAHMPAGYTASVLLGSARTNGSGQFFGYMQQDRRVAIPDVNILNSGATGVWSALAISTWVPQNARRAGGTAIGNAGNFISIAADAGGTFDTQKIGSTGTQTGSRGYWDVMLATPQVIYWSLASGGTGNVAINLSHYTF